MTGMYNVLEKLRAGEPLTGKEQTIHEQGLVSVLKQIHDDLDAAVADAYGWPADLSDEEILARLVALNHERAEEERRGLIRYLRPEFQNPSGTQQKSIAVDPTELVEPAPAGTKKKKTEKPVQRTWPKSLSEQAGAVQSVLTQLATAATAKEVAKHFGRASAPRTDRIEEILKTLGQARELKDGRYIAV